MPLRGGPLEVSTPTSEINKLLSFDPQPSIELICAAGLTMSETNNRKPRIDRAIQDKIGRELRAMYEELLRQPLPEHLTAPLRTSAKEDERRSSTDQPEAEPRRNRRGGALPAASPVARGLRGLG